MTPQDAGGVVLIIGALVGAYIAWRKYRPETNDITVTTADKVNEMTLRFAGVVDEDNEDLREQLKALSAEFTQYRTDTDNRLAELSSELRGEKAENWRLTNELTARDNAIDSRDKEIEGLRKRVEDLESEVARLRDNR